jgi:molybdopterin-guanine dinucleotide biosynthesis protein A
MAIDSVRLLTDSAAQIWRRLARFTPLAALSASESFDEWLGAANRAALDPAEEQALRRDYRRLSNLIEEIETLVRSRARALELVQARLAEDELVRSPAA